MEQWMPFLQERWYVIIGALVVLFLVVKVMKTVVKWAIVLAVLAGVIFYGANYMDQIQEVGGKIVDGAKANIREEAIKALAGNDTAYKQNADGSFTITKGNITLQGQPGQTDVRIGYMGQSITIKADDAIKALIEQAKKNGGTP